MKKISSKIKQMELYDAWHKVIIWFLQFPDKEMSLNDLAKQLEISKTTANTVVHSLEEEEFLKKEVLGKIWRIKCNKNHIYNISKKISHHLMKIYESGILEEIHKTIKNARSIILFGSYRKGDDTEKSDIDIAVEVLNDQELKIIELGVVAKIGYRENVPVNIHVFSRNKINLNLFSNIANGIVLEGFLEVKP